MKNKILSLLMAVTMVIGCCTPLNTFADEPTTLDDSVSTTADDTVCFGDEESTTEETTENQQAKQEAQKTLEQQQNELEDNLKLVNEKLSELEKSSKVTEEYIDTLDQKIGYINEQLTVLEDRNNEIKAEINKLKPEIKENEKQLNNLSKEVKKAQDEIDSLEKKFKSIYEAYCYRLKVLYISGEFNVLSALLSCKDLSSFLTRYEMIKSISKSDTQLLQEVNEKVAQITTEQDGLNAKKEEYTKTKDKLSSQKKSLEKKQKTIEKNQQTIANNKVLLANDRAESDRLLAELTSQNHQYSEFRHEDEELIAAVENEIQALIGGLKAPEEVTTAVASEKSDSQIQEAEGKSDVFSKSDAVLNMTYPVPGHKSVTAGFPNYSSGKYHGGIDFSCPTGSKVVSAQDGIVITVKRLNYSYGYYVMIYHGTDGKGRSVVTLYAHNSSILVSVGESVKRGQQIAKSGSTGNSTGPHCHFEVRFDGVRVNPKNYLS